MMPDNKDQKDQVEKAHAKAGGKPVSPTEDPTVRATSASALAAQIDPKGTSGATVNAASMDKVNKDDEAKEEAEKQEEDQSIAGKIRRSGLYFVRDHSRGGDGYIGVSPQNDPKADQASKERSLVAPLDGISPRTGMQVRLEDGTSFSIPDGFNQSSQPGDWAKVLRPDGSPLFS